ncbi:MAG: hypothetical protein QOI06_229 [Nocardioidaceae bacterium]|nr:hypothetical protein [Nocardioidaceae bacterium]
MTSGRSGSLASLSMCRNSPRAMPCVAAFLTLVHESGVSRLVSQVPWRPCPGGSSRSTEAVSSGDQQSPLMAHHAVLTGVL